MAYLTIAPPRRRRAGGLAGLRGLGDLASAEATANAIISRIQSSNNAAAVEVMYRDYLTGTHQPLTTEAGVDPTQRQALLARVQSARLAALSRLNATPVNTAQYAPPPDQGQWARYAPPQVVYAAPAPTASSGITNVFESLAEAAGAVAPVAQQALAARAARKEETRLRREARRAAANPPMAMRPGGSSQLMTGLLIVGGLGLVLVIAAKAGLFKK